MLFAGSWRSPATLSIGDGNDSPQFMWFLRWPPFALAHLHNPLLTNYIDYPAGMNLMWNASMPLAGALLTPVSLLFGPVVAYNVLATLAVALSAWTAYLAIRRYVRSQVGAIVGGLVYGFSPFMLAHSLGHPHVTVAFIPPLLLIVLDEILVRQSRPALRAGALLGLLAAAQLLIGEELLATSAVVALLGLVILLSLLQPRLSAARIRHAMQAFGVAAGIFVLLSAVPLAIQFAGPQRVSGILQEPNIFVSDLLNFIVPTRMQAIAPEFLAHISDRFTGDLAEWTAYIGLPLVLLLGFMVIRQWSSPLVRFTTLLSVMLALLSLGPTLHFAGRVTHIPAFVLGLAFPALAAFLPARAMLYTFAAAWLGLMKLPVLNNLLPGRLMLFVYLFVGLLLAIFIDRVLQAPTRRRTLAGTALVALALLALLPQWPYRSTVVSMPAFFTSGDLRQVPDGSVALVAPFSHGNEANAMLWEAAAGMRFRMPEGYGFLPGPTQDPPMTLTQQVMVSIEAGTDPPAITEDLRQRILGDLRTLKVQTVIVGPMRNEDRMVEFFTGILQSAPTDTGGVHVWWRVQNP